jgi:hypothetical protein
MRKVLVALSSALAAFIPAAGNIPTPVAAATTAVCTTNPSSAVVGTRINTTCTGIDPNVIVNTYLVEPTGFTEWGNENYAACFMNAQGGSGHSGRTTGSGSVGFVWFTQNGVNTYPKTDYSGYSNQIGTCTVVVQELDGVGGIKTKGTTKVTLMGNSVSITGAFVAPTAPFVNVLDSLTFIGSGFAPNEAVNLWLTRPADCSGIGFDYWTGPGAFAPSPVNHVWGDLSGVSGPSTVKTDGAGGFAATIQFGNPDRGEMPCTGLWALTSRALGSGLGAIIQFEVRGNAVLSNALVWTADSSVTSIGQMYGCGTHGCGIAVHVYGSGFPPGSHVNCWFTRPDGTTYNGRSASGNGNTSALVDGSGKFSALTLTFSWENSFRGEQPGRWAVTCATRTRLSWALPGLK